MKIRVLGGGWYGCHIASSLITDGYNVELHEVSYELFSGASGNIPARLHCGSHYPRSKLTRVACREHYKEFMSVYGHLTRHVPINLYCVAAYDSLLDFGTYCDILRNDIEFVTVADVSEFGLRNVEGAILTGERHILVDAARDYFRSILEGYVKFCMSPKDYEHDFDLTIDCTFCARDERDIERFELCLTILLEGASNKAVTIMDGPYPSLYPWDEDNNICSLTSAKWTPICKFNTWEAAKHYQSKTISESTIVAHRENMTAQMSYYYPYIKEYKFLDDRLAIRAMPRSGSDARLVDVIRIDEKTLRVRAGKIDAIFHACREIIKEIQR